MVEVYLRTIDGCEKKFIGDIIINDDTIQYIKEDGSGEIIYKKYISELRIEGDCPQVEAMGNVHIQAPWERMTAPRYKGRAEAWMVKKCVRAGAKKKSTFMKNMQKRLESVEKSISGIQ